MAGKDFYAILGVDNNATEKDIKKAYRKLARKYHPDVNPNDAAAEARFKEMNEAYEVISDPEKRKKYDQYGDNWQHADQFAQSGQPGPGWGGGARGTYTSGMSGDAGRFSHGQGGMDFENIFEGLFSGRRGTRGQAARGPMRGSDLEHPVEVTLEEALTGTTRILQTQGEAQCPTCKGTRLVNGKACPTCGGAGIVIQPRRLEVKIPAGVTEGSRIRMAGEGSPGVNGGPKGDLYLVVSLALHPRFERKGDDLFTDVSVPLTMAVLGGEVEVQTPKGKLALKIPAETQNGRVFKLGGQGVPRLTGTGRGDLLARIQVLLPVGLSPHEKELFEELAKTRN